MNDGSQGDNAATERNVLPTGWAWATLRDIASLKGGITKGQKRGPNVAVREVPYLRVANVQRGFLDLAEVKTIEATQQDLDDLRLQPGDVLFNEGGDRDKLGRGWVWRGEIVDCIHQNHVFRARLASPDLDPKFVSWYGNSAGQSYFWDEGRQTTNLASINLSKLGSLPIPLPPAAEQRRIVAEIEKQFSRLDTSVAALKRVEANLKRYRASVLQAACEGRLVPTEAELALSERRNYENAETLLSKIGKHPLQPNQGGGELPDGWAWSAVGELASPEKHSICDGPFGSNLKTEHYTTEGPRVIRLQNIGDAQFIDERAHISLAHFLTLTKHKIEAGDLVIASLGERPPRACLIPPTVGDAIVKADCIRFKPNNLVASARYLNLVLNSEATRKRVAFKVRGIGRPRIGLGGIRELEVPIPPLAEQERIVLEVERCLSLVDQADASVNRDLRRAERLRQSILKRAFEGRLVPQDPADEPASLLLERIRAERAAAGGGKPARNGRGAKRNGGQHVLDMQN